MFDKQTRSPGNAARPAHPTQEREASLTELSFPSRNQEAKGLDPVLFPHTTAHLRDHPFKPPPLVAGATAWLEGTFDPFTSSHLRLIERTFGLGFERIILGIVPSNPFKSNVTPLHHRAAMASEVLTAAALPIALRREDRGIYLTRSSIDFNLERLKSWFLNDRFIVMGPDNFDRYYGENKPWTTILPKNRLAQRLSEFQRLYPIFADRLLVSDEHLPIHSTNIRQGESPLLEPVARYADRFGLYSTARRPVPPLSPEGVTETLTEIVSTAYPHLSERTRPALLSTLQSYTAEARATVAAEAAAARNLHDFEIRHTRGRDGKPLLSHHFKAPPFELTEESWNFRPPNPAIPPLRNTVVEAVLGKHLEIIGAREVLALRQQGKQILIISNHLDYNDLAVLPYALEKNATDSQAAQLTIFIGPKMFHLPWNNLLVIKSIGAIKIPQSPHIATEAAVLTLPETAQRAEHAFALGRARLDAGDILAIFPEGARQTTGMRTFGAGYLRGFAPDRLLPLGIDPADVFIVPTAIDNIDRFFLDSAPETKGPLSASVTFGRPIQMQRLLTLTGDRPTSLTGHLVGHIVAGMLPEHRRGVYGADGEKFCDAADFRMTISAEDRRKIVEAEKLIPRFHELTTLSTT